MSDLHLHHKVIPQLYCHLGHVQRCIFLHMFDEVEKDGGVIGWFAWVWKISFTKYMPSIERVQILVVGEGRVRGVNVVFIEIYQY